MFAFSMQTTASVLLFAIAVLRGSSGDPIVSDHTSQCGGYCFNAFKPMLDLLANSQSAKLNETQVKLESLEAQLLELQEKHSENEVSAKFETSLTTKINPRGFAKVGSRFFYIEDRFTLNWYSALIMCRQMGAYLAVIQNEEELNEFRKELNERHSYWLDITRLANTDEEKYSSLCSGKPVTFLKWAPREPSNYFQEEACVTLVNSTMYTSPCGGEKNYFICEAME